MDKFKIGIFICLLMIGFSLGQIFNLEKESIKVSIELEPKIIKQNNESQILIDCSNRTLDDTADCVIKNIEPIFNYTIRKDTIKTFEDIKLNGGDCYDWNKLLGKWSKELGFDVTYSYLPLDSKTNHMILIISDETGYCLLDQINKPTCFYYG